MAMDFMVFFYFTIGGFGARAQFLEVSCSCDLCSGFCRAVQKKKDNNDYTITLVPLQVQDLAHMGQWSDCVHSKVLEFQQLLDCTSATLCTTWGATDSQEKVRTEHCARFYSRAADILALCVVVIWSRTEMYWERITVLGPPNLTQIIDSCKLV
jgi:hypothetical protein